MENWHVLCVSFGLICYWRDVRAAEGARLEIVCAAKSGTEGSNPSLSAKNGFWFEVPYMAVDKILCKDFNYKSET